mgnify:CR=1 FL=1
MSPITNKADAKKNGWAQTREAVTEFKGLVTSAGFDQWGGVLFDDNGNPKPPREFLEVKTTDNIVIAATEDPSMDITSEYNFRANCSDFEGSWWVEDFLDASGKLNILIPEGLQGKVVTFRKVLREAINGKGVHNAQFDVRNYVPVAIEDAPVVAAAPPAPAAAPVPVPAAPPAEPPAPPVPVVAPVEADAQSAAPATGDDLLDIALGLAIGNTDAAFKNAAGLHPKLVNSPLLPLIKAGAVIQTFVKEGKIVVGQNEAGESTYSAPVAG